MIYDTCFLIDLHRDAASGKHGPAAGFLDRHIEIPAFISVITLGEYAEGFDPERHNLCRELLRDYTILDINDATALHYAAISRELRLTGKRLSDNDLWIAATALAHSQPLVTRNQKDFARIENLKTMTY